MGKKENEQPNRSQPSCGKFLIKKLQTTLCRMLLLLGGVGSYSVLFLL